MNFFFFIYASLANQNLNLDSFFYLPSVKKKKNESMNPRIWKVIITGVVYLFIYLLIILLRIEKEEEGGVGEGGEGWGRGLFRWQIFF